MSAVRVLQESIVHQWLEKSRGPAQGRDLTCQDRTELLRRLETAMMASNYGTKVRRSWT